MKLTDWISSVAYTMLLKDIQSALLAIHTKLCDSIYAAVLISIVNPVIQHTKIIQEDISSHGI